MFIWASDPAGEGMTMMTIFLTMSISLTTSIHFSLTSDSLFRPFRLPGHTCDLTVVVFGVRSDKLGVGQWFVDGVLEMKIGEIDVVLCLSIMSSLERG